MRTGVNRWGTVAGTDGRIHVAWKQGVRVPLSTGSGVATGLDNAGEVVGWTQTAAGVRTAVRWTLVGS